MAYGRLDIFWPDGNYETHQLTDENVSIGRSTGNTITLDTDTISRYHCTITRNDDGTFITDLDSANGTFLDGVRLPANQPRQLMGGEEVQIGHLRMIYHLADDSPTIPTAAVELEEETQRIEHEAADFRVEVYGPEIPIAPGAHIPAELTITNLSDQEQWYLVEASGVPREWMRIDRPKLVIDPQESAQVLINFKPLRISDTKPGDYPIRVSVRPQEKPDTVLEAVITLRVLAYGGFGMALESHHIERDENFRLHLHNQGSANLPLTISARSKDDLVVRITPSQVTLAPGQRLLVQGTAHAKKRKLIGEPQEYQFDLLAQSRTPAAFLLVARAYVTEKALMPTWMAITAAGISASVLLILIVGLVALLSVPPPQPVITQFALSDTQVARGETVELRWLAEDVEGFNVYVDGERFGDMLDPTQTTVALDTASLAGDVRITLEGVNGERTATASQMLTVYEPLRVVLFETTPQPIVRYTVQTLTISWDVVGASSARIEGLEIFTTSGQAIGAPSTNSAPLDPEGTIQVSGIAMDTFTLTLIAENPYGDIVSEGRTVEITNPMCSPLNAAATSLHEGPGFEYQVVGQLQNADPIIVDARDNDGLWLRLQISGGIVAWASRDLFACAQNFNVEDLRIELPPAGVQTSPPPTPPAILTLPPQGLQSGGSTPLPSLTPPPPNTPVPLVTPLTVTPSR